MTTDQHITDLLFDYLEERVADSERVAIEAHLARCAECAAVYETGRALRADVARHDARHIAPERLVAIAEDAATPEEETHLAACARCRDEASWLRAVPALPRVAGARTVARPRLARIIPLPRMPGWSWGAVGLAAAAALLVFLTGRGPTHDPRIVGLARIAPLVVEETRGAPSEDAYARGVHRYLERDWAGAAASLGEAAAADPAHEGASLLLGSALLLAGQPEEAARELQRTLAIARDPAVVEEAHWQLANAHLARGDDRGARSELEAIAAAGGPHSGPAREILATLSSF